jgi:opacity protein-like surface antigen
MKKHLFIALGLVGLCLAPALADKVITKDGKVYKGKIMIDSDKAVLIGNPPFDPNSYLIQAEDIDTIVYEEYKPNSPAERRRGLAVNLDVMGHAYSSSELSLQPAAGLALSGGFRFHPLFEIGAGLQWVPQVNASSDLSISDGTATRAYESFWSYTMNVLGKIYPFYKKAKWKTEPYILTGYGWSRLIPKASGDSLEGAGWMLGAGAIRPITNNLFLDGHFAYHAMSYDKVNFLGQHAAISPEITEHQYTLAVGLSYRI